MADDSSSGQKEKNTSKKKETKKEKTSMVEAAVCSAAPDSGKKRKVGNEIDEIFEGAKEKWKKKTAKEEEEKCKAKDKVSRGGAKSTEMADMKAMRKKKKKNGEGTFRGPFADKDPAPKHKRRKTGDGLAIYSAEELGVGNPEAGGTPLCPFDCSCCF